MLKNALLKTKKLFIALGVGATLFSSPLLADTVSRTPDQCKEHYVLGAPKVTHHNKDKVLRRSFYTCNSGYAAQYDPATKNPIWVSEHMTVERATAKRENRTDNFRPNPKMPKNAQATLADYRGSGFDRGHMAPAANMYGINDTAMSESFYLTNIVPQVGPNQNRGIWSDLENTSRKWARQRGEINIISGPIYEQNFQTMGKSKVWIPNHLFKVIIDTKTLESVAFIIPNVQIVTRKTKKLDKGNPTYPQTLPENAIDCGRACNINHFKTSVSQVEKMTGLTFFTDLPEEQRQATISQAKGDW